jgi:hypothetical protein
MVTRSDRPWWIEVAYKIGVPSAIAVFLIWFIVAKVSASLEHANGTLDEHVWTTNFYLHAICTNAAKTEAERENCRLPERQR